MLIFLIRFHTAISLSCGLHSIEKTNSFSKKQVKTYYLH